MNRVDDSYSKKVWVLCCELSGDILVGLQGPGDVMGAAIQLIYLCIKGQKTLEWERKNGSQTKLNPLNKTLAHRWK